MNTCRDCKFFSPASTMFANVGSICKFMPVSVDKSPNDWCGQFTKK